MKLKTIVFFVSLFSVLSNLSAQKKWSLSDCIEYAHANNLQIKRAQHQAEIASNDFLRSKMNILPNVNVSVNRTFSNGHSLSTTSNSFITNNTVEDSYGLYSNLNLFSGLQNYNSIRANQYNSLSKMQDVEREKVEIGFEIAAAYLNILFNQELLEVAENQKEVTSLQVERTDKLVQAGNTARGDLLEIMAQLATENFNVTNSRNELNLSVLNLTQLLDLDSVGNFAVIAPDSVEPDFANEITDVYTVYSDALEFLPHIKSAEYGLLANKRNLAIQKGLLSPTISLKGSWGTGYSDEYTDTYFDQLDLYSSKSLMFSINIPIFNRWDAMNKISNAKIGVLDSETNLDLTKQQLYKEIQQAYNDAISARDKYNSAFEAVKSYQAAFGYTEQKFNVGIVNSVEYNVAKNNYIKAESDLLKAKYEYIFALKILDYYRGVPLSL